MNIKAVAGAGGCGGVWGSALPKLYRPGRACAALRWLKSSKIGYFQERPRWNKGRRGALR